MKCSNYLLRTLRCGKESLSRSSLPYSFRQAHFGKLNASQCTAGRRCLLLTPKQSQQAVEKTMNALVWHASGHAAYCLLPTAILPTSPSLMPATCIRRNSSMSFGERGAYWPTLRCGKESLNRSSLPYSFRQAQCTAGRRCLLLTAYCLLLLRSFRPHTF